MRTFSRLTSRFGFVVAILDRGWCFAGVPRLRWDADDRVEPVSVGVGRKRMIHQASVRELDCWKSCFVRCGEKLLTRLRRHRGIGNLLSEVLGQTQ